VQNPVEEFGLEKMNVH